MQRLVEHISMATYRHNNTGTHGNGVFCLVRIEITHGVLDLTVSNRIVAEREPQCP
jgi:hypothetical protein